MRFGPTNCFKWLLCRAGALGAVWLVFQTVAGPLDVWQPRWNSPSYLQGVAYGNGTFVAVGINGTLAVSMDGATWTQYITPPVLYYEGVTFGGGMFVAYGYPISTNSQGSRFIIASADGITWSKICEAGFQIRAASFGNNKWVFAGDRILTGTINPPQWTEFQLASVSLFGCTYGMGRFVVGGSHYSFNTAYILSSTDGLTWRYDYGPVSTQSVAGIAYGNGVFVAAWSTNGGSSSKLGGFLISTNLSNWVRVPVTATLPYNPDLRSVVFGGGEFIGGIDYKSYTSADGIVWTNRPAADGAIAYAYGRGTFVAATPLPFTVLNIIQSDVFADSPTNPPIDLSIATYAGVTINGTAGSTYRIEYTTTLDQGAVWLPLSNVILPTSPFLWIDTNSPALTRRFYRAVQLE